MDQFQDTSVEIRRLLDEAGRHSLQLPFLIFVILLMIAFQDFDHQLILIFIAIGRWSG